MGDKKRNATAIWSALALLVIAASIAIYCIATGGIDGCTWCMPPWSWVAMNAMMPLLDGSEKYSPENFIPFIAISLVILSIGAIVHVVQELKKSSRSNHDGREGTSMVLLEMRIGS